MTSGPELGERGHRDMACSMQDEKLPLNKERTLKELHSEWIRQQTFNQPGYQQRETRKLVCVGQDSGRENVLPGSNYCAMLVRSSCRLCGNELQGLVNWLGSSAILFIDLEIWISYDCYIPQNTLLIFSSHVKIKADLSSPALQKDSAGWISPVSHDHCDSLQSKGGSAWW